MTLPPALGMALLFAAGLATGVGVHRAWFVNERVVDRSLPKTAQFLKPGPWGNLARIPLTIAPPEEMLPIRSLENAGTRWFFKGFSPENLGKFLDGAAVAPALRDQILAAAVPGESAPGLMLKVTPEILLGLESGSRLAVYRKLMEFRENRSDISVVIGARLEAHLADCGVSEATRQLFARLCVSSGKRMFFSGVPLVLARTEDYDEKLRFMKALTSQDTFLLRFHVDARTDLEAMSNYWGQGRWSTDLGSILESLQRVPGGVWSSAMLLLPPLPSSWLYSYPTVADNPLNGPPTVRDCHWTSLNFFRDQPDPRLADFSFLQQKLKESYAPIVGDPRYGDIAFFTKPNGETIHSAVYLADEVVYTKNGDTFVHPWMLSTVPELVEHYSAPLEAGAKVTVSYFRRKAD